MQYKTPQRQTGMKAQFRQGQLGSDSKFDNKMKSPDTKNGLAPVAPSQREMYEPKYKHSSFII